MQDCIHHSRSGDLRQSDALGFQRRDRAERALEGMRELAVVARIVAFELNDVRLKSQKRPKELRTCPKHGTRKKPPFFWNPAARIKPPCDFLELFLVFCNLSAAGKVDLSRPYQCKLRVVRKGLQDPGDQHLVGQK